jgi:hypothetical protein
LFSRPTGCEWNLFADIDDKSLSGVDQILTEFHFTTTLRLNGDLAKKYVQKCFAKLKKYYMLSHYAENPGAWYDRHIDAEIVTAGIPTIPESVRDLGGREIITNTLRCCSEMTLGRNTLQVSS